MTRKLAFSLLFLTTIALPVLADTHQQGYYAGLSYSQAQFDGRQDGVEPVDNNFNLVNIGFGFQFSPYLAMEARYGVTVSGNQHSPYGDTKLDRFYSAYAIPSYPINEYFTAYALLGGTAVEVTGPGREAESDFSYGFGLRMAFANNSEFFLEYSDHGQTPYSDISAVTFGVNYHF